MELEAKYKVENFEEVLKKVESLGFKLGKEKHQVDTYFIVDRENEDGTRDYLRVREDLKKNSVSFEFHKVLSDLETDETEIKVEDKEKIVKIMENLGLNVVCVVNKDRKEYNKDNITIVFDVVENLGNFVEIEVNAESTEKNKNLVWDTAKKIGLTEKDRVSKKGYPDLLMENAAL